MNTNTKDRAHIEPRKWYTIMLGYGGSESRPFAAVEKTGEMTPSRCYSLFGGPGETMIERPPCAEWRMIDDNGYELVASDNDLAANGSIGIGTLRPEDFPLLTDERLAVLVETGKRNEEKERKEAEEAKRRSEENQRRLAREYSWLPNKCEDGYMRTAKVAQNVRAHLKREFPGVKFSVRSEVFSGGDSIRVKYADGPAYDDVARIVRRYQDSHADAESGDYWDYDPSDFNRVCGGAKYTHCEREMSEATEAALYAGIPNDNREAWDRRASIHRVFQDTTLPVGAVVTGVKDGEILFDAPKPAPARAVRPSSTATPCEVSENVERNGVEIRFASIPSEDVRDDLKANGWRWSRFSKCWYNRASDEAREFAQKIAARASA